MLAMSDANGYVFQLRAVKLQNERLIKCFRIIIVSILGRIVLAQMLNFQYSLREIIVCVMFVVVLRLKRIRLSTMPSGFGTKD